MLFFDKETQQPVTYSWLIRRFMRFLSSASIILFIKGSFLSIGLENYHHSCRLADNKGLCTIPLHCYVLFLSIAGKILIYVLMFMYNSGKRGKCYYYIKHFCWSICRFSYSCDRYLWSSKICITEVKKVSKRVS